MDLMLERGHQGEKVHEPGESTGVSRIAAATSLGPSVMNGVLATGSGGHAANVLPAGNRAVMRLVDGDSGRVEPSPTASFVRAVGGSGPGSDLPGAVREQAEARLGAGLADVELHADGGADGAARAIEARAFTIGNDIYFARGNYRPTEASGRRLLLHELTHVVQGRHGTPAGPWLSRPGDLAEREAEATADRPLPADPATPSVTVASATVHRDAVATGDVDAAQRAADSVWEALDGWNNEGKALAALQGHEAGTRDAIQQRFRESHGVELSAYLKDQLSGQDLVRAIALLHSSNTFEPHTQLALTMYGLGSRDEELFRILQGLPLSGRQNVEKQYNEVFSSIGSGTLRADLAGDLSGWELEKATALLHRDLTQADHLYFNSVAIGGTHDDAVIAAVQGAWAGGLSKIAALDSDWKQYVNNQAGWTSKPWTTMSLRTAMQDELSGEALELVVAVLDQYEKLNIKGADVGPSAIEEARLAAAEASLTAATTGGYTGWGTNEAQVFGALTEIHTVWEGRLRRLAGSPEEATERGRWERRRAELLAFAPSEMDTDTAGFKRARLLLSGNPSPADEVYLAKEDLDSDKVVDVVTTTWAAGTLDELLKAAAIERRESAGHVIRPAFDPAFTVPVTSGMPWRRVNALVRGDQDDVTRGAARLKLELDDDDSDGALRKGYALVKPATAALRTGTVRVFADSYLTDVEGADATHKFLTYIQRRYDKSTTCWDFADLLDPAKNSRTMLERAQGRMDASHTGFLDAALNTVAAGYGELTGEQSIQVAQESLDRLKFIAEHEHASDTDLDAMAAMLGKRKEELAGLAYEDFKVRLEELRSLRQSIVDAFAAAAELVVSAALTFVTGGGAAGLLLASLGSALAGMLVRESLQGVDYEFTSDENLQRLVVELAAAGMGAFGGVLAEGIGQSEALVNLGRTEFMRGALQDAFGAVGRGIGEGSFSNRMPSVEDIAARALAIAGTSAGGGAGKTIGHGSAELTTAAAQLRKTVGAAITNQLIAGMSDEASSVIRTGIGNSTAPELAGRFARRGAASVISGMVSGAADAVSQRRLKAEDAELVELPDATIISGGDRHFTAKEADGVYANCRRDTPDREVALLENAQSGERIVIQGHATLGFGDPQAFRKTWEEFQQGQPPGTWRLVRHSHAAESAGGVTRPDARLPSGRGGDLSIAQDEALQSGRPVQHAIDLETEQGPQQIQYGYDPSSDHPFWVEVLDAGGRQRIPFESLGAYGDWYERRFGHRPDVATSGSASPAAASKTPSSEAGHVRRLGEDPATGKWRQSESETACRVEQERGVKLERSADPKVDWVDADGKTYDAVGNFKSQYFDAQWENLKMRIVDHLAAADFVPVDVAQFTPEQVVTVRTFTDTLGPRVFLVGE